MPTAIEKGVQVAKNLIRGVQKLKDPSSVDSRIDRGDLLTPDSEPAIADERSLIDQGEEWFEESRRGRHRQNARIFSGIAMYQGRQHDYWDEDQACMMPLPGTNGRNPDFDERMLRSTWNIIQVFAERTVARVMATDPDAWAASQTDSDEDKQAAQILRAVNAHCSITNSRKEMLEEALLAAYISTTCFIKTAWNPHAWAEVAFPQPDGTISYKKAQIGDVENTLMLCIDAYPDPNASLSDIHSGSYFIERSTHTIEYIKEKWGVTPSATGPDSTYGFLEQRLEYISDDRSRWQSEIKDCTDVTIVWNKPSPQFPKGRHWGYTTDGTFLFGTVWPYEKKDQYPFIPVRYAKAQGTIWGMNGVDRLKDIQIKLNDIAAYLGGRLQWDRLTGFVPDDSDISPESLLNPAIGKIVPYNNNNQQGEGIHWNQPPSPPDWLFTFWDKLVTTAEYIAGVRDFNTDAAKDIKSGFMYELMVEQEKSRLGPVIRHMDNVMVDLMEWDGAFYRQFGTQYPRLLGIDDKATPDNADRAQAAIIDLRALKNGSTRVVLQPGSGQSKSPAAQEARLDEIVKNLANPNVTPPLAKLYLSLSQAIRSNKQVDDFNMEFSAYFAQQSQQAAQVQQMKGEQAQGQMDQKAQLAKELAQIDMEQAEAEAAMKVKLNAETQAHRAEADTQIEGHRVEAAAKLETLKFAHAAALLDKENEAPPKFSVSMPFKPGPTAIRSAEEKMGLEPDSPAEAKAAQAPPPVKGPPSKKKAS